jgi:hypothetical protein
MATPTTLPATFVAGAFLTAAQQNALRGAFRVLQVVSATSVTAVSTTSSSFVTSGLTATITPSSTSSKIYVVATLPIRVVSAGLCSVSLFRGTVAGTNLAVGAVPNFGYVYNAGGEVRGAYSMSILDSPSTVSAQAYTVGIVTNSSNTIDAMNGGATGTITLMEISA